jgi:broad specificity phosphatase PhoE
VRTLHLVRHARSLPVDGEPAERWGLDPSGTPDLRALAESRALPPGVPWYSSPEPKALATAHVLAHPDTAPDPATAHECACDRVRVVDALAEHRRAARWFDDPGEFRAAVVRAFDDPARRSVPEWEPLALTRDRLLPAVRRILETHPDTDVALAGHGTAWTLLVAELTGTAPDLEAWAALRMPDVWTVTLP